tara:strand:- start:5495 stop:5947 length:453 start_codon:yes stop_codon:yes gene_type:complete
VKRIILISFLIFLDLLVKKVIFEYVDLHKFIYVTSFLDITHIHNFGVSFGLFAGIISPLILVLISSLVVIFLFYLMIISKDSLEKMGLVVIIAGAMGNIIDRLFNGYVIDFIYFHYKDFYWPAFNFADIYITIGIIMILLSIINKIKYQP